MASARVCDQCRKPRRFLALVAFEAVNDAEALTVARALADKAQPLGVSVEGVYQRCDPADLVDVTSRRPAAGA